MQSKEKQPRLSANVRQAKANKAKPKQVPPTRKSGGVTSALSSKYFGRAAAPETAQQSIPYREMHRDGVCRVNDRLYTKTIAFGDINYQLARNEDKTQIFESYCDFLNYFDSSISVQLTFVNRKVNIREFQQSIEIPERNDDYNAIRREYAEMLKSQLDKGNNGLVKSKYVTFGVEADSLKTVRPRLERVETDILNNFKAIGVAARPLTGLERLEIIHGQFHPDGSEKLRFAWRDIPQTGLSTKDYVAPTSFDFRDGKTFKMGDHYGAVSFVQILAPELTDRMLADFLDLDTALTVNMHIQSIDQAEAIKTVKRKLSDLDAMKIAEQKKAVRAGYDMDVLPSDLVTYGSEAKTLLEDLQSRNERTVILRYCGVPTTDWGYDTAIAKAKALGLTPETGIDGDVILRDTMAVVIYRGMNYKLSGESVLGAHPAQASAQPPAPATAIDEMKAEIVRLTNIERVNAGLPELTVLPELMNSAQAKADDMLANHYYGHKSPVYGSGSDMIKDFVPKAKSVAENLAPWTKNTAEAFAGWVASKEHYDHIVNPKYTHIGIGIVEGADGGYWWVQHFAKL